MTGKTAAVHSDDEIIGYELAGSSEVFRGKYKLMIIPPPKGTGNWELYDMNTNPSEINNLSKEIPAIVKELRDAYTSYEEEYNIVPVPIGYNPIDQLTKNSKREGHN